MVIQDGTVNVFGNIHASGSITPGSSSGFKQDLADLSFEQSLELIQSLDAISFAYIADPNQPRLGFIAEEVPKIFGTENRKGVDPMGIATALTVAAYITLTRKVTEWRNELRRRMNELDGTALASYWHLEVSPKTKEQTV